MTIVYITRAIGISLNIAGNIGVHIAPARRLA